MKSGRKISYTGYVTINDSKCIKIKSANPLCLILNKLKINGNKYLMVIPINVKERKKLKTVKNCRVKTEIKLGQYQKTQMIMIKKL